MVRTWPVTREDWNFFQLILGGVAEQAWGPVVDRSRQSGGREKIEAYIPPEPSHPRGLI